MIKPSPRLFHKALEPFGPPGQVKAVFVGNSLARDVAGACAAELPVVWINKDDAPLPAGGPQPQRVIRDLAELMTL